MLGEVEVDGAEDAGEVQAAITSAVLSDQRRMPFLIWRNIRIRGCG